MSCTLIKAHHLMEERYAQLVLEYAYSEVKNSIDVAVDAIKKSGKYSIEPSIDVSEHENGSGEYSIEFFDDYDREAGEYFEELLCALNICKCEDDVC